MLCYSCFSKAANITLSAASPSITIQDSLCKFVAMTTQEATYFLMNQLKPIFSEGEASAMTDWVMEHLTGSRKAERMIYKNEPITAKEEALLKEYTKRLMEHEPVQYVLNESWFCGLKFYVDKNVLIPRSETEELVEWIISNCKFPVNELTIVDIGSGSGCIPVSLKRRIRKANVWGCDSSAGALAVAQKNADELGTDVHFVLLDFLNEKDRDQLPAADIIVSNPPYIPLSGSQAMNKNVLAYEPHMALFVPDNDPLVFYQAIAAFGKKKLLSGGAIYTEIHEDLGKETTAIFKAHGYSTELKKDMQGKERMIKAVQA
jgi:release factor glutamine methyltransferase